MRKLTMHRSNGALAILLLTAACASPAPNVEANFGQAVTSAKARQTLDANASANTDPVAGIGGVPAKESVDRYNNSFKAPPPTFVIINAAPSGGGQ
jgi:hypothetical protein